MVFKEFYLFRQIWKCLVSAVLPLYIKLEKCNNTTVHIFNNLCFDFKASQGRDVQCILIKLTVFKICSECPFWMFSELLQTYIFFFCPKHCCLYWVCSTFVDIIYSIFYTSDRNIPSILYCFITHFQQSLLITNCFWTFLNFHWSPCDQNSMKELCTAQTGIIHQSSGFVRTLFLLYIFLNFWNLY